MRRRFFVEEVRNGHAEIAGEDAKHLTRVLRVEVGQKYEICDNRGVFLAEIEMARKERVVFRTLETLAPPPPQAHITLCAALIKFDRFEWMVEKATELGVAKIVPVIATRSERGLDRAAQKRVERWRRIALEASQQARRAHLPEIEDPVRLRDICAIAATHRYVLDECVSASKEGNNDDSSHGADHTAAAKDAISADLPANPAVTESRQTPQEKGGLTLLEALPDTRRISDEIALLLGPEGGWTDEERAIFSQSSAAPRGMPTGESRWIRVSMGPLILRAETAAIAALAVLRLAWLKQDTPPEG